MIFIRCGKRKKAPTTGDGLSGLSLGHSNRALAKGSLRAQRLDGTSGVSRDLGHPKRFAGFNARVAARQADILLNPVAETRQFAATSHVI